MNYQAMKTWKILKCILLSERTQSEKTTYCTENGKTVNSKKIRGCQELRGRRGWIGEAQRIFRAVKSFSTVVCWWIHVLIRLSQPTECTPKVNPHVNFSQY